MSSAGPPAEGGKKEKKTRPPPPPPPAALATASLLVRAGAAKVLGVRPGPCGGDLQPVWVTEPGHAKVTIGLDSSCRSPFPKAEQFAALIDAIEVAANTMVIADSEIVVFEMDRSEAETKYGHGIFDATSSKAAKLPTVRLAYLPGSMLVEVPPNWALCSSTGKCGTITFEQKVVDASSNKKPDTMILFGKGKKLLMVRYATANADAACNDPLASESKSPSAEEAKALDVSQVSVSVPGVDADAAVASSGAAASVTADRSAAGQRPLYPYPKSNAPANSPEAVYWAWFREGLGERLRTAVSAAKRSKADLLRAASVAELCEVCRNTLGVSLSEAEVAHLTLAPFSPDWLRDEVLSGLDMVSEAGDDMEVDPWNVSGKIDYRKLIEKFGSTEITPALLERIERLTVGRGHVPCLHPWLRRGIFFSHRDLDHICSCVEKGIPFYLYTGRGPSSAAMHLGHLIPFMMTKWLQDAFDVPLVIQMTDDEKFLWKGNWEPETGDNLMHFRHLTTENAKDIIACGFDKKKTFIFSDLEYFGHMYPNIVRIWKAITYNTARSSFGFQGDSNIGQSAFPAVQAAPSFPSTFKVPLKGQLNMACLIPCAIDQDPYFRITRDIAHKLVPASHPLKGKPALLHSKFFPPLQGAAGKMSASDDTSAVYLTETSKEIEDKIMKYAFSGGQQTAAKQKELGANLDKDVSYQWLRFFLDDDDLLEKIGREYGSGEGDFWNTGSVKKRLIVELQRIVNEHQERRAKISDEEVAEWMHVRELEF